MSYFPVTGIVDSGNSTATALGAAGVFTGTGYDCTAFSTFTVIMDSDVSGTLSVEFSTDNLNWDRKRSIDLDITLSTGSAHTFEVISQYYRLVYTNGSTVQAHFRMQSILHHARSAFLTSSPNQRISRIDDVQLHRVVNSHSLDASRGLISDQKTVFKFGANDALPNGSFEYVWENSAAYTWAQAAETVRIAAGGDVNDTAAGSGAQSVTIQGLDENFDEVSETVVTAGASASAATTTTFFRVFRAFVETTGTYTGVNAAIITIEGVSTSNVYATIGAEIGQSQLGFYTIPAGYTGYLTGLSITVEALKPVEVRLFRRLSADDVSTPFTSARLMQRWLGLDGSLNHTYEVARVLPEKTDVWFEASGSGAASKISLNFELRLIKGDTPTNLQ